MNVTTKAGETFNDADIKLNLKKFYPRIKDINNELFSDAKRMTDAANRIRQQLDVLNEINNVHGFDIPKITEHGYHLIDEFMGIANYYRNKLVARHCPPHKIVILNEIYASSAKRIAKQREKYGIFQIV
jgi:hypothetical protein